MDESEDQRVVRAAQGDGDALEELLREVGSQVATGLSIDPRWRVSFEREDVMQVSYLEAYLRIKALRSRTLDGLNS